jgi:preprotein translocase subunit SecG
MMSTILIIVHVIVCVALIMIVLLQTGKGADMGAAFGGGGSQTLFGSTGASTFLSKATTGAAIIFMLTSLALAYLSSHRTADSIIQSTPAPVEQQAPAAQGGTATQEDSAPVQSAPAAQEQTAPQESNAPAKSE